MEAVARIALALARHRQVDGHQDGLIPGIFCSFNQPLSKFLVSYRIQLEPEPSAHFLRDALDAERRGGGHGERHAPGLCGAREDQLRSGAAGADASGGRDGKRQRGGFAK